MVTYNHLQLLKILLIVKFLSSRSSLKCTMSMVALPSRFAQQPEQAKTPIHWPWLGGVRVVITILIIIIIIIIIISIFHCSQDSRSSYRSQSRDSKQSSYQPRPRPSSRNFDEDKSKLNDVDSYLAKRATYPSRVPYSSERDRDRTRENDTTSTSSYKSRRTRHFDEGDTTTTATSTSSSRPTSNYLRSTSAENVSSRFSEREREKERQREKESEKERQSEKEKEKEKETEKESADKSPSSSARARKMRRPREKRRSTGVAYMPSEVWKLVIFFIHICPFTRQTNSMCFIYVIPVSHSILLTILTHLANFSTSERVFLCR